MGKKHHAGGRSFRPPARKPCSHRGKAVRVGPYQVYAGGTQYLLPEDLRSGKVDLLVSLTGRTPELELGVSYRVLAMPLVDFGGVPDNWRELLNVVIEKLEHGTKMLAFCVGSHGRTGCFLGSLIALLESRNDTPDPIKAVRERHCDHAVETYAQAEAIFALRGDEVPAIYHSLQGGLRTGAIGHGGQPLGSFGR